MKKNKFRIWDKKRKEMSYSPNYLLSSDGLLWRQFGYNEPELLDQDDFEIMFYARRKDKNEKKMFGGDIVKGTFYTNKPEILKIGWSDKFCGFTLGGYPICIHGLHSLEIIGNEFENPELMR